MPDSQYDSGGLELRAVPISATLGAFPRGTDAVSTVLVCTPFDAKLSETYLVAHTTSLV